MVSKPPGRQRLSQPKVRDTVAQRVAQAIAATGRTKGDIARAIGSSPASFSRKLNGHVEFDTTELGLIARETGVSPGAFFRIAWGRK